MSAEAIQVEILSPSRVVAKVSARQLLAPGVDGYMGILPGHTPLITEIGLGQLAVEGDSGTTQKYFVAGGFLEVQDNRARVLVDVIEQPKDIDRERVLRSRERALGRLSAKSVEALDMERAQQALRRADARLEFLESIADLRMA